MARILVGWELGAGLGHITRLMAVARALSERGHRPFLALRNLVDTWPVYGGERFPVFQAPIWQQPPTVSRKPFHAAGISDIFAKQGFTDPDELQPMVHAWHRLIGFVRPSVIVSDYSPTLCLAAYGSVPMVIVGDGFTAPPDHVPYFPLLRPKLPVTAPQERLLSVIREVQRRRHRPAPPTLPGLFSAAARFICTIPELDPYRAYRREPMAGPFQPLPPPAPFPDRPGFFAYLAADAPSFRAATQMLLDIPMPGRIYVRRAPQATVNALGQAGHHVYDKPAPLAEIMRDVPVVIHHGGIGTTELALAVGRPQLLLPRHLEQNLTGRALKELGTALVLKRGFTPQDGIAAFERLCAERAFRDRAMDFAAKMHRLWRADNAARIADRCVEIIAANRVTPP